MQKEVVEVKLNSGYSDYKDLFDSLDTIFARLIEIQNEGKLINLYASSYFDKKPNKNQLFAQFCDFIQTQVKFEVFFSTYCLFDLVWF